MRLVELIMYIEVIDGVSWLAPTDLAGEPIGGVNFRTFAKEAKLFQ